MWVSDKEWITFSITVWDMLSYKIVVYVKFKFKWVFWIFITRAGNRKSRKDVAESERNLCQTWGSDPRKDGEFPVLDRFKESESEDLQARP